MKTPVKPHGTGEVSVKARTASVARPKVMVLEGTDRVGGGQRVTLDVISALSDNFEFTAVAPGDGDLQVELHSMGIDLLQGGYPAPVGQFGMMDRIGYLPRGIVSVRRLVSQVKRTRAGVIYATSRTVPWAVIAGSLTGTPVIVHLHMVPPTAHTAWFLRRACSAQPVKKILVASTAIADRLSISDTSKIELAPNGVDTDRYAPRPGLRDEVRSELSVTSPRTHLAAVVGELSPAKGQLEAIIALSELARQGRHYVKLVLAGAARTGNTGYEAQLRKTVSQHGLSDRVIFTGQHSNVSRLLNGIDLLIVPSRGPSGEACPMAVLEAWATGVPVLGSNSGGLPEMLANGRGAVFEATDQTSFAREWLDLIDNPGRMHAYSASGLAAARGQYSQDVAMDRIRRVLNGVIGAV